MFLLKNYFLKKKKFENVKKISIKISIQLNN